MDMITNYYRPKRWVAFLLTMLTVCLSASATAIEYDAVSGYASQYSAYVGQTVDVTVKNHPFSAGWGAYCFPFSADKVSIDNALGEGNYVIQQFDSYDESTGKFVFHTMETPAIVAGQAYLIKMTNSVESPVFVGAVFTNNITDDFFTIASAGSVQLRGFYFRKYSYLMYDSNSAHSHFTITSSGTLEKSSWLDNGFPGICAYFFVENYSTNNITPAFQYEASSSGSGEGGEGGEGGDTPAPTSLEARIAAKQQLTDIPTIYIDVPTITDETSLKAVLYKNRKSNADEEEVAPYSDAVITVVDNSEEGTDQRIESFSDDVQIKVRGNSTASAGNGKVPYRLKFAKGHKHDLLGLGYDKRNWTLIANNYDGTMVRNALTYHVGQYVGMDFTPGYKYVDLVISGMYRGTYMVSDHCETGSNRIDINEDTDWYMEFECWGSMAEEPYVGPESGNDEHYVSIKNPDADDLTEEQITQLKADVRAWRKDWYSSFSNGNWMKYNDLESFVKFYIATEITGDLDSYFVFKGYKLDGDNHFHWGPLWDKDLAFGNYEQAKDPEKLTADYGKTNFEWCFKNYLFKDKSFLNAVKTKLDALIDDGLEDKLIADIDRLVALIAQSRELNYTKWSITNIENGLFKMSDYDEHVDKLKEYVRTRISFIQNQIDGFIDALPQPTAASYNPELTGWEEGQIPTAGNSYNLTVVNRTLTGGQWNAVCFPFDATTEQIETALGCTYQLAAHTGMDTDGTTMLFTVLTDETVECGVPYLLKPANDVTSFGTIDDIVYKANLQYGLYNGDAVSWDDGQHRFCAQIYKKNVNVSDSYQFTGDVYVDGQSLVKFSNSDLYGARAYIVVPTGETPAIRFVTSGDIDEPDVRTQLTDVPTIYIDTQDGAEIQPSSGDYVKAAIQVVDANGRLAEFTDLNDMEIRGKGSWDKDKKSYRLKFAKKKKSSDGLEHKYDLTGAGYVKRNWVLLGNAGDESLLRNALTKALGDGLDMPFTPTYCFVDVVLNGEYIGAYVATDFIEADAARVFAADEKTDWLLQMTDADDVDPADLYVEGSDTKPYITIKNPDSDDYTDEQKASLQTTVQTYFDQLWADNSSQYYDQTSLVNWYIAAEILGGYKPISDFYAYKADAAATLSFGPLWDNDSSYDNTSGIDMMALMADKDTEGSYDGMAYQITRGAWAGKLAELWQQEWFKSAVLARWNEVKGTLESALTAKVAALKDEAAQTFTLNYDTFVASDGAATAAATLDEAATQISNYLEARFGYLDVKFAELASASAALKGDVNNDGHIDINDVMALVSYICGETPEVFNIDAAYVNSDNDIDINDVMMLVDMIIVGTEQ